MVGSLLGIRKRIKNYIRVLKVAKKPGKDEFFDALKICLMGLVVVGILGFVVYIVTVVLS